MKTSLPQKPPRARMNCRHLTIKNNRYPKGIECTCSQGLTLTQNATQKTCFDKPSAACDLRKEWTAEERKAWKDWVEQRMEAQSEAMDKIRQLEIYDSTAIPCPHCDGQFEVERTRTHGYAGCTNPACLGPVHYNIGHSRPWPPR